MKQLLSVLVLLIGLQGVIAQTTEEEIEFSILRDEHSLTFVLTGGGEINFNDICIDSYLSDDEVQTTCLKDYFSFLELRPLRLPACLRIQWDNFDGAQPRSCTNLASGQRRIAEITESDIFWLEREITGYFDIEIFQGDRSIGFCEADQVEDEVCRLSFVPAVVSPNNGSPTPANAITPTVETFSATPSSPTVTFTVAPTETQTISLVPELTTPALLSAPPTAIVSGISIVDQFASPGDLSNGITWTEECIWITDNSSAIFCVDESGNELNRINSPGSTPEGITSDGTSLWVFTTGQSEIYQFTVEGRESTVTHILPTPNENIGGGLNDDLAWADGSLWYSDTYTLFQLAPSGEELDSIDFGRPIQGFDWDGKYFWIAFKERSGQTSLSMVDTAGSILFTTPLAFEVSGLAWGGGSLWAIGNGTVYQFRPITQNADWTPIEKDFGGVIMVLVPVGCFEMGDAADVAGGTQCFDEPFWIDRYEVSNAQFIDLDGEATSAPDFNHRDWPRVDINWFEASRFCQEKRGGFLPTEAEWEYAARGPDGLIYPWGHIWNPDNLVWSGNSNGSAANIGSRAGGVSWIGARDLSGNVWEWVSTRYDFPYPYATDDGRETSNEDADTRHVMRGGSFDDNDPTVFSTFHRNPNQAERYWSSIGFRCARAFNKSDLN